LNPSSGNSRNGDSVPIMWPTKMGKTHLIEMRDSSSSPISTSIAASTARAPCASNPRRSRMTVWVASISAALRSGKNLSTPKCR